MNHSREQLVHSLYEAAELEHNLMCTYLYAVFSLRSGEAEGLTAEEAEAVARWRRSILDIAIGEMGHLAAVWNITAGLGAVPRFGRTNFPLDPGFLPAGVVVKLAPFNESTLQHFVHLERPDQAPEPDGEGFAPVREFVRSTPGEHLTPMGMDYETVGEFYSVLADGLKDFVALIGESAAFCGDGALQLSSQQVSLEGANPVICAKTALAAIDAIVVEGEGARGDAEKSHFQAFKAIRAEYRALKAKRPEFKPAFPAATNPVLRRPPNPEGRVWLEDPEAIATVDLANATYGLMLRLMAYSYSIPAPEAEKSLVVDLALSLMRAVAHLGEHAARLPAGPSHPECHAGMSFTSLRDAAPFPRGEGARRFFVERLNELTVAGAALDDGSKERVSRARRALEDLNKRAAHEFGLADPVAAAAPVIESAEAPDMTLLFEGKRCIHARFCVTGAPTVFLANVKGPWLHPETMDVESLVSIAKACPSGAIRYQRKDGKPDEAAPPVNLAALREGGPYAFRAELLLDGQPAGFRATLCRCGASKNKPFCDGSHHEINFSATGEPPTGETAALAVRDGPLAINPQTDGPLQVRGNLEITSGTGRVVARTVNARLCRCGGSSTKPFCDGTHARIGFKS